MAMLSKLLILLVLLITLAAAAQDLSFIYNGFKSSANLSLDGIATFTSNGLLMLTNGTKQNQGHAFYPNPVTFKASANSSAFSFSTSFVFGIASEYRNLAGHGLAFVIAPTRGLPGSLPSQYLDLFNLTNNGKESNHVFAVELDTIDGWEFSDINDNHVGFDINGLTSVKSTPAGYYADHGGKFTNLSLISGKPMQVWVDYDGIRKQISATLAPIHVDKPIRPLLSLDYDLSPILSDTSYIGFSSATGSVETSHCILGWSFKMNGQAQALEISQFPKLPRMGPKKASKLLTIGVPVISVILVIVAASGIVYFIRRKRKFAEEVDDWEIDYGPHRFRYKDLYIATKGFREKELLGVGGFGRVYKGVLPKSKVEIAVKRVSHESRQGMKEFVAEIVSIGRLRHRNLVSLLGYCRRKGELLLVYDYMPNGSFDKYLHDQPKTTLTWNQRFRVIKGVASGLLYLHEEWEQVVIHRDVKASNVLIDGELNGRLGDFGLARLYNHGTDPQTTRIAGTLGYLAPEQARTGKATTSTDVYAFGAFLLEVACGRRPVETNQDTILVDWVFSHWLRGALFDAKDSNLGTDYVAEEVELVLKLGLVCSHSEPEARPSMHQVAQILEGEVPLPEISAFAISASGVTFRNRQGFSDLVLSDPSFVNKTFSCTSSIAGSQLSGGR
ncbi:hypothetical protein K2173_020709 [Erythroxylum novogranatense]|uniref:non-specific serine/threonine protein kinase n=1 Tax=Erythroxylum novogranatense TaxID=1862640 RepID=A0AAV8TNP6_9ROSI|nr:hypothetical protein K2173_020709 [Erythroxylum novogranatense]